MQTLIIVSHPTLTESNTQRFLWESLPDEQVTWHHLDDHYSDGQIDVKREQALLQQHDRILFQFPLYWYSSPPLLKQWQDMVLTQGFAYGRQKSQLEDKEFGLVISTGVRKEDYQPGAREGFSIAEITKPFQAVAKKCGMRFLPPFLISRFDYMVEIEKRALLIHYRQYVTQESDATLAAKEAWFKKELLTLGKKDLSPESQQLVDVLIGQMETNRDHLDDLVWTLQEMKE